MCVLARLPREEVSPLPLITLESALIKDSVLFGMQLDFVYNIQMNAVGYTTDMTLYDTFGAAIHSMCTDLEMHEKEWDFLFHTLFPVPRHWTPHHMGMDNADVLTIYCRRILPTKVSVKRAATNPK